MGKLEERVEVQILAAARPKHMYVLRDTMSHSHHTASILPASSVGERSREAYANAEPLIKTHQLVPEVESLRTREIGPSIDRPWKEGIRSCVLNGIIYGA